LRAHLDGCPNCRHFAETTQAITRTVRNAGAEAVPHPAVRVALREAAAGRHQHRLIWFPRPVVQLAACAALFTLVVGAAWLTMLPQRQRAVRVRTLSTMVAIVNSAVADNEMTASEEAEEGSLEAVARQLLELEGFAVDDLFESDEAPTLYGPPASTTTQWHKTPALPAETCV